MSNQNTCSTNPSPTDLITKALPAIEWIAENTDCTGLSDWVTIDPNGNGKIREISDYEIWVHNPPAVLAAICMWVNGEVVMWVRDDHELWGAIALTGEGKAEPFYAVLVHLGIELLDTTHNTYPEATIAMLLAIVECLKGGG